MDFAPIVLLDRLDEVTVGLEHAKDRYVSLSLVPDPFTFALRSPPFYLIDPFRSLVPHLRETFTYTCSLLGSVGSN
jgi:hypothetical protein